MDTLDKGMSHIPGGTEWDGAGFHCAAQSCTKFKTEELFISGIFHPVFLDCGGLWLIETTESETAAQGRQLYFSFFIQVQSVCSLPAP